MQKSSENPHPQVTAEVIDFDAAMMDALSPETRLELYTEAAMLMEAFATEPHAAADFLALSEAIIDTAQNTRGRAHARRLSAALGQMAKKAA